MLNQIVGQIDWPAAIVLVIIFAGIGSIIITAIVKHKSKADIEIENKELDNSRIAEMYKLETWRATEVKKLEQNLITSHRAE